MLLGGLPQTSYRKAAQTNDGHLGYTDTLNVIFRVFTIVWNRVIYIERVGLLHLVDCLDHIFMINSILPYGRRMLEEFGIRAAEKLGYVLAPAFLPYPVFCFYETRFQVSWWRDPFAYSIWRVVPYVHPGMHASKTERQTLVRNIRNFN